MSKKEKRFKKLKRIVAEVNDIYSAISVLSWDQSTYMPGAGAAARGRHMATLGKIAQEKFTDPTVGKLLEKLASYETDLDYDSDDAAFLRVTRRNYERAIAIPTDFLVEVNMHQSEAYQAWTEARPANDFARMVPLLEKTLDYSRQLADFFPGYEHIADPLIDMSDYGMRASSVRDLFAGLRDELVPIVKAITSQPAADDSCLRKNYSEDAQLQFAADVVQQLGYDINRGRIDKTPHPFMIRFSSGDVRITTRSRADFLGETLFSNIHEAGHAMYEQGVNPDFDGTPLAGGTSSGVHESQSRLWENIVGRSRAFWEYFYPKLQAKFRKQLKDVDLDTFYRAINKVERSLIRTDADEVTYNLHVMLRFDFELQLLEGTLAVRDLADAWRARMESDLGIAPPDDRDGVLQDVHWYAGGIGGMFQGYTIGNILSAQFYSLALEAYPDIPTEIGQGKFDTLRSWLQENIHQYGRKYTAPELIERVTGSGMSTQPYIEYLKNKYGALYTL